MPYAEYTIRVSAPGFEPAEISGIQILSSQLALQNVTLHPIAAGEMPDVIAIPYHTLYGIYPPKIAEAEIKPVNVSGEIVLDQVLFRNMSLCMTASLLMPRQELLCPL